MTVNEQTITDDQGKKTVVAVGNSLTTARKIWTELDVIDDKGLVKMLKAGKSNKRIPMELSIKLAARGTTPLAMAQVLSEDTEKKAK